MLQAKESLSVTAFQNTTSLNLTAKWTAIIIIAFLVIERDAISES